MAENNIVTRLELDSSNFQRNLSQASNRVNRFSSQSIGGLSSALRLLPWAAVGAGALALGSKIISVSSEFENLEAQLKTTLGSAEKAAAAMSKIEDIAKKTPFTLAEVTKSWRTLSKDGLKASQKEMIALSDLASSEGQSLEHLTDAIQKMYSGNTEQLRGYVDNISKVGDKFLITNKGITTEIEAGNKKAIASYVIAQGQMEGVAGASENAMQTFTGVTSNLQDNLSKLGVTLGKYLMPLVKDVLSVISKAVSSLNEFIDGLGGDGKFLGVVRKVAFFLKEIGKIVIKFNISVFAPLLKHIKLVLSGITSLFGGIATNWGRAAASIEIFSRKILGGLKKIADSFKTIWSDLMSGNFSNMGKNLRSLWNQPIITKAQEKGIVQKYKKKFSEIDSKIAKDAKLTKSKLALAKQELDLESGIENMQTGPTKLVKSSSSTESKDSNVKTDNYGQNAIIQSDTIRNSISMVTSSLSLGLKAFSQSLNHTLTMRKMNLNRQKTLISSFVSFEKQKIQDRLNSQLESINKEIQEQIKLKEESVRIENEKMAEIDAIHQSWLDKKNTRLEEQYAKEFLAIDEKYNQEILALQNKNLTIEEIQALTKQIEDERESEKQRKKKEVEAKEKQDTIKKEKEVKAKKELEKIEKKKERKEIEQNIVALNTKKKILEEQANREMLKLERDRKKADYIIGYQTFLLDKKAKEQQIKLALGQEIAGITASTAALGPFGWGLAAAQSAFAISRAQQNMIQVKASTYPPPMGFNRGGLVPGIGNTDTVPAMLTPGELVVPKESYQDIMSKEKGNITVNVNVDGQAFGTNEEIAENLTEILKDNIVNIVDEIQDDKLQAVL